MAITYHKINSRDSQEGFTLLEMAIVLLVIGFLVGTLLPPLSAQINQANYSECRRKMIEIREALIGYGLAYGHLPCPAKNAMNGDEDRNVATGVCNKRNGFLPWSEIGVEKLDVWGHLYLYSVTNTFSQVSPKISLTPAPSPDITIKTRDSAGALINLTNANAVPFVVISAGKNGNFATLDNGVVKANRSLGSLNADENSNATQSNLFISRTATDNVAAIGGEYDDMVVWTSLGTYFNKMVSAGQLP